MHVIALCGLPGSGKSTLANALADATGCRRLDRDRLRAEIPGIGYGAADKRLLRELMRARMQQAVFAGDSVILDGMTFSRDSERAVFRDTARRMDAKWLLAWLDCDPTIAHERVAQDTFHPAKDRTPELVQSVHDRFESPPSAIRLDALRPVNELVQIVIAGMRRATHERR